jgi:membrane fusion protein, multidrug efflux system
MNTEKLESPQLAPPKARLNPAKAKPRRKGRGWLWLLALALVAGGAYFLSPRLTSGQPSKAAAKGATKGGGIVPVVVSQVKRGSMNIYLDGLGNVTAFYTVTLKTRVDGEIMRVAFEEGQLVNKGDLLIEIDPRPFQVQLEQAQGQLVKDQATLSNARLDLDRYKGLYADDAIPKQQLDTQVAMVDQLQGVIQSDQSQIDNAKLQLVYSKITAPITGRIGLRLVDPGNIVHATDTTGLAVITQLQPIAVIFTIAEDHLPQVMKRMNAGQKLAVEAWDRDNQHKIATGSLLTIDNQIDQSTGTVRFKAVFDNADLSLFPNQFVNARLLIDTRNGALIAPSAAIQRSPDNTFIYVVNPNNTVEARNIVAGPEEGDQTIIEQGLHGGEQVVIDGIDKLQPGSRVSISRPAAAGSKKGS